MAGLTGMNKRLNVCQACILGSKRVLERITFSQMLQVVSNGTVNKSLLVWERGRIQLTREVGLEVEAWLWFY